LHRFIPALASSTGARITEVPITDGERQKWKEQLRYRTDDSGLSGLDDRQIFAGLFDTAAAIFRVDWGWRDVAGTAPGRYLAFEKFAHGVSVMAQHGPLMLLAVALFISGVQFVSMGCLAS